MAEKSKIAIKIVKINSSTMQLTRISSVILGKIRDKFSALPDGYQYQPKFRLMGIKGVKIYFVQVDGSFPAGLFSDIVTYITDELNKKVVMSSEVMEHFLPLNDFFTNGIKDDIFSEFEFDGNPVALRDYQLGAVDAAFENRHCLLNLSTGAGKCLGKDTILNVKIPKELASKYKHLLS